MSVELDTYMAEMVDVKDKIKKLTAKKEELRTNILLELKTNDLTSYETEDAFVKLTVNKRKSFDKNKAINFITEKGGEPEEFYSESDYEILNVKQKGGKDE